MEAWELTFAVVLTLDDLTVTAAGADNTPHGVVLERGAVDLALAVRETLKHQPTLWGVGFLLDALLRANADRSVPMVVVQFLFRTALSNKKSGSFNADTYTKTTVRNVLASNVQSSGRLEAKNICQYSKLLSAYLLLPSACEVHLLLEKNSDLSKDFFQRTSRSNSCTSSQMIIVNYNNKSFSS